MSAADLDLQELAQTAGYPTVEDYLEGKPLTKARVRALLDEGRQRLKVLAESAASLAPE